MISTLIKWYSGYKIYDTYFNKTTIKVLENVEVEFTGFDGSGRVSACRLGDVDYDKTDVELTNFINSITLKYDVKDTLKNGDEVEITATYDHDKADALKLNIEDATTKVKVKGLTERYKTASKVPNKISSDVKKLMDEKVKTNFDDKKYGFMSYKSSFVSMYYGYDDTNTYSPDDCCIGIYKIEMTTSYSTPTTETYYIAAYLNKINSDYSTSDKHTVYTTNLYDSSYKKLSDESQLETAVEDRFDDYQISKFD